MLNSFDNYLRLGKVKRKTPDMEESEALLRKSIERLAYIKEREIRETTAKFLLEDAYESMREATQSLMSAKGYKPYSHEATISFLKKFYFGLFGEERIIRFDVFREKRNASVYNACHITTQDARSAIILAKDIVGIVKSIQKPGK